MLVPNDRMEEVPAFLPRIRRGQRVEGKETVRIAKDGTALDVSLTVSPIAGPGGDVTGMAVIARDITGQKATEAELRRSSRYFELSRDMVCTAGLDGRFRQLNGTWTEVLGWTTEELRSRPFVDFVHPEDREATIRETGRLAEGATTTPGVEPDQWAVGEAGVGGGVGKHQDAVTEDRRGAERPVAVVLTVGEADARLGPQAVDVDQVDHGDRHVEDPASQAGKAVETILGRGVEQAQLAQRPEALLLVARKRSAP
jgi:PAS domain-containing protein